MCGGHSVPWWGGGPEGGKAQEGTHPAEQSRRGSRWDFLGPRKADSGPTAESSFREVQKTPLLRTKPGAQGTLGGLT